MQGAEDLLQDGIQIVAHRPPGVMRLEPPDVTYPPDMVARPIGLAVRPPHFASSQFLAFCDRLQHRAIAIPTAADIIDLAAARSFEKMPKRVYEIKGVDIIAYLLPTVSENDIGGVAHRAFYEI